MATEMVAAWSAVKGISMESNICNSFQELLNVNGIQMSRISLF